nr:PREDICTED: uncharacterized protein LOC105272470 [Fopius arisanus]
MKILKQTKLSKYFQKTSNSKTSNSLSNPDHQRHAQSIDSRNDHFRDSIFAADFLTTDPQGFQNGTLEQEEAAEPTASSTMRSCIPNCRSQRTWVDLSPRDLQEKEIHAGEDVWIKKEIYDRIRLNAKSYSLFVKEVSFAIIGESMAEYSVTGKVAPRTGIRKESLCPTKLLAVRGIFEHYLRTHRLMKDDAEIVLELDEVGRYVGEKINDMIQAPKKAVRREEKRKTGKKKLVQSTSQPGRCKLQSKLIQRISRRETNPSPSTSSASPVTK